MDKVAVSNVLSDVYAPNQVSSGTEYWSFLIDGTPTTVLHISETWARSANEENLRALIGHRPVGEILVTELGVLAAIM